MTITTKYEIGQKVYFMDENKIHAAEIQSVNIFALGGRLPQISYNLNYRRQEDSLSRFTMHENLLYQTKQELLNEL